MNLHSATRRIRSVLSLPLSLIQFDVNVLRPFLLESGHLQHESMRRQMRVLRRDHYRCRSCDKKENDVAICIATIRSWAAHEEAMLVLCTSCHNLTKTLMLDGKDIPDFLRQLWYYLHHTESNMPKRSEASNTKIMPSAI
jgi:hypothetical protein